LFRTMACPFGDLGHRAPPGPAGGGGQSPAQSGSYRPGRI